MLMRIVLLVPFPGRHDGMWWKDACLAKRGRSWSALDPAGAGSLLLQIWTIGLPRSAGRSLAALSLDEADGDAFRFNRRLRLNGHLRRAARPLLVRGSILREQDLCSCKDDGLVCLASLVASWRPYRSTTLTVTLADSDAGIS
jgi:hypothetical protein